MGMLLQTLILCPHECAEDHGMFWVQDMSEFKEGLMVFLSQHGQFSLALTVQQTPGLLAAFMEVTSNALRMHLLARHMPYKQIIQLYTLVYATVEVRSSQPVTALFDVTSSRKTCHQ